MTKTYSVCRNHNPIISSFMTYHMVCNQSNKTAATNGAGTAYPSGAPEFTDFQWGSFCSIISFLCNALQVIVYPFVLFLFVFVLYVLRFTSSDYPFGIFKLSRHRLLILVNSIILTVLHEIIISMSILVVEYLSEKKDYFH